MVVISKPRHAIHTPLPWAHLASIWHRTADAALSDRLVTASVGIVSAVAGVLAALIAKGTSEAVYIGLGTLCLTPGCGLVCWLSTKERLTRVVTVIGASLTWTIIASTVLAWLQVTMLGFLLAATAGVGAIGSAVFLIVQMARNLNRMPVSIPTVETEDSPSPTVVDGDTGARFSSPGRFLICNLSLMIALAAAGGLLAVSVSQAHKHAVGNYGLLPVLGISFLTAAVLTVEILVVSLRFVRVVWPAAVAALGLLLVEFNATPMMLATTPLSSWTYKHFGVVDYIVHGGALKNPLDIYQQWPGFFAAAAALARLSGRGPLSYSNWAQLFFEALDAVVIFAIARHFAQGNRALPYVAVLLFETANWEGQFYYSPQTTAFSLTLLFQFFLLPLLEPTRLRPFLNRRWFGIGEFGIVGNEEISKFEVWMRITGLIVIFGAIMITHQMSPYVVLVGVIGLWLLGVFRRWATLSILALMLATYALLHVPAIDHNQLLTGFDLDTVAGQEGLTTTTPQQELAGHLAKAIGLGLWAATAVCVLSYRRRLGKIAIPTVLASVPIFFMLVTNYDGEAINRVFMFSSPWCAVIIAIRLATLVRMPLARWAAVGIWLLFAALGSAQAQDFGMYPMIEVPQGEINASSYFLDHAPPKATLVLAAANFPSRLNYMYVLHNVTETQNDPSLDESRQFDGNGLDHTTPKDLASSVARLAEGVGYLVIAPSMERYSDYFGIFTPGTLSALVPRLMASPYWKLWYENDGTWIFRAWPKGVPMDKAVTDIHHDAR